MAASTSDFAVSHMASARRVWIARISLIALMLRSPWLSLRKESIVEMLSEANIEVAQLAQGATFLMREQFSQFLGKPPVAGLYIVGEKIPLELTA